MNIIQIYFEDDSELAEYEATSKGYRVDVYVAVASNVFHLHVYTLIRLQQDFDMEIQADGYFSIEPNLVLVKESSRSEITKTINKLYLQGYFDHIKSLDGFELSALVQIQ